MKIACVYIYPPHVGPMYEFYAHRFVDTYLRHPPLTEHDTIIVCNSGPASESDKAMFEQIKGSITYFVHNNVGFDVGGFQAVAKEMDHDFAVWFGSSTHFHRSGWLLRFKQAWQYYAPALYANSSSDYPLPHVRSTGFACSPKSLLAYPIPVVTGHDRYEFEHGQNSFTMLCARTGHNVALVTWTGIYGMNSWRTPPNIYQKGNQTNCLVWDGHIVP